MKVLRCSLFVLFALLFGSAIAPSLSQAVNLTNQVQKVENHTRWLIAESNEDYVNATWYNILGRYPDAYGLGMESQKLRGGEINRQQMADNIANGDESRGRIKDIYKNYLLRDPSPSEVNYWVNQLRYGKVSTFDVDTRIQNYADRGGK